MSINKVIEYALEVIVILLVATWALGMFFKVGPLQKQASSNTDTIVQSMTTASYSAYDNKLLSGSDAVTAINTRASKDITVSVTTLNGPTTTAYTFASYNLSDASQPAYIEPSGNFQSDIVKTTNGTVKQITFVQK